MKGKRHIQIGDAVRDVLARALREEVHDPRIGFVTLTGVDISPDLRYAKVWVSTLGDDAEALEALEDARPVLQRAIARQAKLRFTPRLRFQSDRTSERGFHVEKLIDDALEHASEEDVSEGGDVPADAATPPLDAPPDER